MGFGRIYGHRGTFSHESMQETHFVGQYFSRWAALLDEKSEEVFVPFSPDADKIYMPEWIMEEYDGNEEKR